MVGLVEDNKLALPLTQEELADATGLTAVHINRAIQRLRKNSRSNSGRVYPPATIRSGVFPSASPPVRLEP